MSWESCRTMRTPEGALYPHAVDDTEVWSHCLGSELEATAHATVRALERFGNQADQVEIRSETVKVRRAGPCGRRIASIVMAGLKGEFPAIMVMVDASPLHVLAR